MLAFCDGKWHTVVLANGTQLTLHQDGVKGPYRTALLSRVCYIIIIMFLIVQSKKKIFFPRSHE